MDSLSEFQDWCSLFKDHGMQGRFELRGPWFAVHLWGYTRSGVVGGIFLFTFGVF